MLTVQKTTDFNNIFDLYISFVTFVWSL